VVLLRAVRKAAPFLSQYSYETGEVDDTSSTQALVRRLLDSHVLSLCSKVFTAFDEQEMFRESTEAKHLKRQFKSVFQNITDVINCVQCQKCRLHAKLHVLGVGTALKILLLPDHHLTTAISRDEIVGLFNTLGKLSESIGLAQKLTTMYWKDYRKQQASEAAEEAARKPASRDPNDVAMMDKLRTLCATVRETQTLADDAGLMDVAMRLVAQAGRDKIISEETEDALVARILSRQEDVLLLAKHYESNPARFIRLAVDSMGERLLKEATSSATAVSTTAPKYDAIVVGTGLAGMATSVSLLDRGARVLIIEKEPRMGGNSAKASSGINAAHGADVDTFLQDTVKSAGGQLTPLRQVLANESWSAVEWLRTRMDIALNQTCQLGGHSSARTWRPSTGMIGAEVTFAVANELKRLQKQGKVEIMMSTTVTDLIRGDDGTVLGVTYTDSKGANHAAYATSTVLASGGYGHDWTTSDSLLLKHRNDLKDLPTTLGTWTTGDGLKMAMKLGAGTVDMTKVQLHPTGFIDDNHPEERTKVLAGEITRGVGGLLLDRTGKRFVNELTTRQAAVDAMVAREPRVEDRIFFLVMNEHGMKVAHRHATLYSKKGLMKEIKGGVEELAKHVGVAASELRATLESYNAAAAAGVDEFGKTAFHGAPWDLGADAVYLVGKVTPVIHYTMGGLSVDLEGKVLTEDNRVIPGLYAAGEVSGGVHGNNRLGGNSLLECTVFGRIVGNSLPLGVTTDVKQVQPLDSGKVAAAQPRTAAVTAEELAKHTTAEDCWVVVHGQVYDFTEYLLEHPGGAQAILDVAGKDGTEIFDAIHSARMLDDFEDFIVGPFAADG